MTIKLLSVILFIINLQTHQPSLQDNAVESNTIRIVDQSGKTYASGSRLQLEKAFGKTKIIKEADEVLGGFAYTYYYKGFEVYFNEKNWQAMEVKGRGYKVVLNGHTYAVGDNISKLKSDFPLSYKHRQPSFIRLGIKYKNALQDAYVAFTYNPKGIITSIEIANDNS